MAVYDVALWTYFPQTVSFPFCGEVEADSPLLAVLILMEHYKLKRVARAAVGLPDGSIQRWERGVARYSEEQEEEETW
jgi:hypothetical protein